MINKIRKRDKKIKSHQELFLAPVEQSLLADLTLYKEILAFEWRVIHHSKMCILVPCKINKIHRSAL